MKKDMKKAGEAETARVLVVLLAVAAAFVFGALFVSAAPEGVDTLNITNNETYAGSSTGSIINISGGYIATVNLTTTVQNPHWKAFVGWVNGAFTLDDSSGSTIYDWSLTSTNGQVYATRQSGSVTWGSIVCANTTTMEAENTALSHSNADDNITATFSDTTHGAFSVGGVNIGVDTCPTLNTYVDNVTQDALFNETVLYDGDDIVYSVTIEDQADGFDENTYDFQMLVPENGAQGFSGATAYYVYVEVN